MKLLDVVACVWTLCSLLVVLLGALAVSLPAYATQNAMKIGGLQVICAPDTPVAHPDESITVRAWVMDASEQPVSTSIKWTWSVSVGTIKGGEIASWSFGPQDANTGASAKLSATVTARSEAVGQATCELAITLARPTDSDSGGKPGDTRAAKRLSGRVFILPGDHEQKGYGLYSYLLFDSPPINDTERTRHLGAIVSYLQLIQPISEMERYHRRSQLNLTLVPVKQPVSLPDNLFDPKQTAKAAEQVLAVYDYARAQSLLAALGASGVRSGPYLISTMPAGSGEKRAQLLFDMSRVVPSLVPDWFRTFCALVAQERSWSEITLNKLALNTRNVLAVMARDTPEVVSALTRCVQVLK